MLVLMGLTLITGSLIIRSAHHIADVMEKFPGTQDMNCTAYNTPLTFFEHLPTQPEVAHNFAQAMTFLSSSPALSAEFVFAYDWIPH